MYRTIIVIFWVLSNSIFFYLVNKVEKHTEYGDMFIFFIAIMGTVILTIRFMGTVIFLLMDSLDDKYLPMKDGIRTDDEIEMMDYSEMDEDFIPRQDHLE